jgi:hypothetical protein
MGVIYELCFEMALCGMMYVPSFVNIGASVQVILRFRLRNLKGCKFGITDGRDLWNNGAM